MYYGQGAGGLPTGSAVVADIINISRSILAGTETGLGLGCYLELPLLPSGEYVNSFYIRLKVKDEPRVFASLALFFAEADISFASIIQKPRFNGNAEIVLVTHPCRRAQLSQALTSLKAYSKLEKIYNVICMENF
jgi:homoserine dehydrogenase